MLYHLFVLIYEVDRIFSIIFARPLFKLQSVEFYSPTAWDT